MTSEAPTLYPTMRYRDAPAAIDFLERAFGFVRREVIANENGTVSWNENMSRDYNRNREFYAQVFGYHYGDVEAGMIKYATLDLPHGTVGGIGELPANLPAEVPAHWMTYFRTPDVDADVARVPGLGGQVLQPPFDTPYGRMAVVADDQGAVFSLITPTQPG